MPESKGSLYIDIHNHVATIMFGHPAGNSLPSFLLERIVKAFNELSKNEDVHVIVLKSEGDRAFCGGASFDELIAIDTPKKGTLFFSGFAHVINAMRQCTKPIVGRIQGKAVGGAVGLISACDYCLATESAAIKLSELTIGIGPFVIEPAITRKIGIAGFQTLAWEPTQWKNAYWAKEQGLYARVFETTKELDKNLELFVENTARYNPEATRRMKTISWKGTTHWEELLIERATISGELVLSEFTKKALERFKK